MVQIKFATHNAITWIVPYSNWNVFSDLLNPALFFPLLSFKWNLFEFSSNNLLLLYKVQLLLLSFLSSAIEAYSRAFFIFSTPSFGAFQKSRWERCEKKRGPFTARALCFERVLSRRIRLLPKRQRGIFQSDPVIGAAPRRRPMAFCLCVSAAAFSTGSHD